MTESVTEQIERLKLERPDLFRSNSKYVSKLSYADRCAFYGFWRSDFNVNVLCEAFGIARPTGRYIVRNSSPHYRNVRKEYVELGHEEFLALYCNSVIGQEWFKKVMAAKQSAERTNRQDADLRAKSSAPNKRASQKAGPQNIHFSPVMGGGTLTFDVRWIETPPYNDASQSDREEGWYLVLAKPSEGWPEGVYGENDDRFTSTTALQAFLKSTEGTLL